MRDDDKFDNAVDAAHTAFWDVFAERYPDAVKVGNQDEIAEGDFYIACTTAAQAWLAANPPPAPKPHTGEVAACDLRVIMRPPLKGERGWMVVARTAHAALAEVIRESEEFGWVAQRDHTDAADENGMIAVTIEVGGRPTLDAAAMIERAKREILADIEAGRVPEGVRSFAELHDHVDANGYGGFFDEGVDPETAPVNEVQNALDAWLKSRPAPAPTKVTIYLEVTGDPDEIYSAIDEVLDGGTFQDAIRDYADDQGYEPEVRVTSVVVA